MHPLAPRTARTLHCTVTSKKGVIGIGVPKTAATQAAVTPAEYLRLVRSCPIFLAARTGSREARRSAQAVPVRQPVRAAALNWRWVRWLLQIDRLEATMADRTHARAIAARTSSPAPGTPDPIQLHATAHNALGTALHHLRQPHVDAARARRKVMQALAALRGLDVALSLEG
jgi:hypothetical protein